MHRIAAVLLILIVILWTGAAARADWRADMPSAQQIGEGDFSWFGIRLYHAQLWSEHALSIDQLLAYSAVCGTGLDTIPLPGDVTAEQLARIIGDVATLSVKLSKPLGARLLPVAGAKAGDRTTFDSPNLVNAVIQPLP